MHRFLVTRVDGGTVTFSTEQAHQLKDVLRLRPGDRVRTFDGQQRSDRIVELLSFADGRVIGEVPQAPEPRTTLVVCPALLPRDKFEQVLQKLTEVGAAAIQPVLTARSLVRAQPDEARLQRWRSILCEATEQSGRGRVPELRPALLFGRALANAQGTVLLAAVGEQQSTSLGAALRDADSTISLFVGPEGGFEPWELDQARQAGARIVNLGPHVLRAETASPVFAALVLYELEGRDA